MTIVNRLTRLIESDSGTYPLFMADLTRFAPNTVFGPTVDSDCLIDFGLEVVNEVAAPLGDVVTEGSPELVSGEWRQTWVIRSFNEVEALNKLTERKDILKQQAESLRVTSFAVGFPYDFGEGNGVLHVQVRASDRGNISDLRTIAKEMIAAELEMTFPFRVYENVSVALTAPQMVALADKTFQQVLAGYQVSWDYKDAIDAATSIEDLPATPTVFFTL